MDENEYKWDLRFLDLAKLISTWSKDPSTKTGAVITAPDKRIVSVGFNGFPKNMEDIPENYNNRDEKYSRIIHCEMNAMMFAKEDLHGYTLYTYPFLSCHRCAVHMFQKGISRFVSPNPTVDQLTRWGQSFEHTRKYAQEVGISIAELDISIDNIHVIK